jgi:hypothetical protein
MGAFFGRALCASTASSVESTPPEKRISRGAGARSGSPRLPACADASAAGVSMQRQRTSTAACRAASTCSHDGPT